MCPISVTALPHGCLPRKACRLHLASGFSLADLHAAFLRRCLNHHISRHSRAQICSCTLICPILTICSCQMTWGFGRGEFFFLHLLTKRAWMHRYDCFSAQLANPNLINPEATWPVTQTQQECSAAGPNTFNLDAHLEPSYHKYSFADEANTSGTLQTYAYGNTGLSVPGKHRSSPGNSLWTSDILPLTQWSSDAFAVTHSVDSSLLPLTDTTKSLISVPLDRVNYSQYGSNHRSSCWPPVTLPDAAILTAAFSGTTFPTSPIAMHYNIFERPSE